MTASSIHILSTRPLEPGLLDQAARKNIRIDILSFIETESVRDSTLTHRIRLLGPQALTAVFTSTNAVDAVASHLETITVGNSVSDSGGTTSNLPWRIFCIGAATRRLVEARFGPQSVAGIAPSAAALAEVILNHPPPEVFFFCGDQRREELPKRLAAAGVHVHELVVYETIQAPHKVVGSYDGIIFFSPSAVHSFFSLNSTSEKTILFAIGTTTADTIRTYVKNPVITSTVPEKESLVRQMIGYYDNMKGSHQTERY
jgi:uroporphyrinogen-III synthase